MSFFRINNNLGPVPAAQERLLNNRIGQNLQEAMERLSSGRQINRSADDAAGLRVASTLQTQYTALTEAYDNTQAGINLLNTADQGLGSVTERLDAIRNLTVQAGNPTLDQNARRSIQTEIDQNVSEIRRIANETQFGSTRLLNGDYPASSVRVAADTPPVTDATANPATGVTPTNPTTLTYDATVPVPGEDTPQTYQAAITGTSDQVTFQIGTDAGQTLTAGFGDVRPESLGLGEGRQLPDIDITQEGGIDEALAIVDEAQSQVGEMREGIGAVTNRLTSTANDISVASENMLAAGSRITDTDYARETSQNAINQLILQANLSVQSQTQNLTNNLFLDLLR